MSRLLTKLHDNITTLEGLVERRQSVSLPSILGRALHIHDSIVGLMPRLMILAEQRRQLEAQLSALKTQLISLGEDVSNS